MARTGVMRGAYRVLEVRPEGKETTWKTRCRWEGNIKVDLREVGWGGMDWIDLVQGKDRWRALVNAVMNLRGQQNAGNFLTS